MDNTLKPVSCTEKMQGNSFLWETL